LKSLVKMQEFFDLFGFRKTQFYERISFNLVSISVPRRYVCLNGNVRRRRETQLFVRFVKKRDFNCYFVLSHQTDIFMAVTNVHEKSQDFSNTLRIRVSTIYRRRSRVRQRRFRRYHFRQRVVWKELRPESHPPLENRMLEVRNVDGF